MTNEIWQFLIQMFHSGAEALLTAIASFLASFLPTSNGFSLDFYHAISQLMSFGSQLGFVIPWGTIFTVMVISSAFELALFVFKIIAWLVKLVRG